MNSLTLQLYATASMLGAAAFSTLHAVSVEELFATFAGMAVVLALRLAGIRWKISLPVMEAYPHRDSPPKNQS